MIYEQFPMFTGGTCRKTGVDNENLCRAGVVSKDFVVRMVHCYARSSWKIKQNFTAAKVTKYTQTQGS